VGSVRKATPGVRGLSPFARSVAVYALCSVAFGNDAGDTASGIANGYVAVALSGKADESVTCTTS